MRILVALCVLISQPNAEALRMAINCTNTGDCSHGETCVAGDSVTPVQTCVAGVACGGSTSGSCPSDLVNGQLACIKRDGIYKCLSIDRCDEYFGNSLCSGGCNADGVQCSGQGSCSVASTSLDGVPSFGCTCNNGFSGDKCETGATSGSASQATSRISSTSGSIATDFSLSTSSSLANASSNTTSLTSGSVGGSSDSSLDSSWSSFPAALIGDDTNDRERLTPQSDSRGSEAVDSDSSGTSSAVFIIIGILAACIIFGSLMFAMYSRKRKREQEAEAGGIGVPAALAATAGESGADTPKSNIVTM
ncbi:unnamed protein product [Peronospora belbahrii]|uniref:EGF-like domain-containing protein n=1 Tax=Peronospora belbahrii TaxID=622444 RepID=A0AAU9LGY7_9STRA|nr:unnamed protein product [Peronospora belbahrii]CAH0516498.1 unnamed protein product [Peronospora belbahrii]